MTTGESLAADRQSRLRDDRFKRGATASGTDSPRARGARLLGGVGAGRISARTVESHVGAVLRKLQLDSRHEVTHWAATRSLIDREDD